MKSNKALTEEQKKQDVDLWIIALVTGAVHFVEIPNPCDNKKKLSHGRIAHAAHPNGFALFWCNAKPCSEADVNRRA